MPDPRRHSRRLLGSQCHNHRSSVRTAQPRTRVPSGTCAERTVVSTRNVSKCTRISIERRIHEPRVLPLRRVRQSNQSRPQRRNRTRSSNCCRLPVDSNGIPRRRIGIACNIRHATSSATRRRGRNVAIGLPRRKTEQRTDAASSCALVQRELIPYNLARHLASTGHKLRSAAREHVWARSREVHMIASARNSIGRAVIATRHRNGHAYRGRCLARLIQRGHRLLRPRGLRPTPADRQHARLVGRIMYGRCDCVDESLIRIRREVHNDLRPQRYRCRDLDIQHHLAVRAVRIARRIRAVIYRNRSHLRSGYPKALEIRCNVRLLEATAKLKQPNRLSNRLGIRRETIELRNLNRRIAHVSGPRSRDPMMRLRLRPVVQAQEPPLHAEQAPPEP